MRQQIDCAVLALSMHRTWLEQALRHVEPAMNRIRIHPLEWETDPDRSQTTDTPVAIDIQAFAKSSVGLRRYDACLLPVSLETLGWTRQALAAIPRGPFIPLIGVFNDLRSAAMQDLLELGLTDFLRLPLCPQEYRARLLSAVSKVPKPGTSLREPDLAYASGPTLNKNVFKNNKTYFKNSVASFNQSCRAKPIHTANESFRLSKAVVVEQFERDYVMRALEQHSGNIAKAARASNKHRRAFWALMRKYQIDAAPYRPDDDAE